MGRDVHCPSDMSVVAPVPGGVDIDMSAAGSYRKANGEDLPQGRVGSADGPGALAAGTACWLEEPQLVVLK